MLQNRLVSSMHESRIDGSSRKDTVKESGKLNHRSIEASDQIEEVMSKKRGIDMRSFGAHPCVARGKR